MHFNINISGQIKSVSLSFLSLVYTICSYCITLDSFYTYFLQ